MNNIKDHNTDSSNLGCSRLKYLSQDTVILDFPFILSHKKQLKLGQPYMKIENWLTDKPTAVRLLDVWDDNNIVFLKIQDLETSKIDTISHNLKYNGEFWIWSLASFDYLMNLSKERCGTH